MARRLCDELGIWEGLKAKGIVDVDPYVEENDAQRFQNLGLPMNFSWQVSYAIAESLSQIFKTKTAIEWEKELSSKGVVCVRVQSFKEWMDDEDAKRAKISDLCEGLPQSERQVGRTAWLKDSDGKAHYPGLKKLKEVDVKQIDTKKSFKSLSATTDFHQKPLEGFIVVDFTNVLGNEFGSFELIGKLCTYLANCFSSCSWSKLWKNALRVRSNCLQSGASKSTVRLFT